MRTKPSDSVWSWYFTFVRCFHVQTIKSYFYVSLQGKHLMLTRLVPLFLFEIRNSCPFVQNSMHSLPNYTPPQFAYTTVFVTGKMIVHFTRGMLGRGVKRVSKLKRIPHVPKRLINLIHLGGSLKSFLPCPNETRSNNNLLYNTRSRREFTLHLHY